jgi:hypothetical protein
MRHVNAAIGLMLRTPILRRTVGGAVCELRFVGRRSGRRVRLPVMYAQQGDRIVVLVGGSADKQWWRNFSQPHPAQILLRGALQAGVGHVATDAADRAQAEDIYTTRFPDLPVESDPLVVIDLNRH